MTVALTVLRRTPMRWFALLMASIQVAMMLTDFHSWRLVLSQASAAVTTPWLFLAPLAAAGAAWTTRHLLPKDDQDAFSGLTPWHRSLYLQCLLTNGLLSCGVVLLGALTARTGCLLGGAPAGPLWWSYLFMAISIAWSAAAFGTLLSLLGSTSWFSALLAALLVFGRLFWISETSALTRSFLDGSPDSQLSSAGLASAAAEMIGMTVLALGLPALLRRLRPGGTALWPQGTGSRLRLLAASTGALSLLITASLLGPVLTARPAPAQPLCVGSQVSVCLWPEESAYLAEVSALSGSAAQVAQEHGITDDLVLYEVGLEGVPRLGDFQLVNGSTRFLAADISTALAVRLFTPFPDSCLSSDDRLHQEAQQQHFLLLSEVAAALELAVTGEPRPAGMHDTTGVDWEQVVHSLGSATTAERIDWVEQRRTQAQELIHRTCAP